MVDALRADEGNDFYGQELAKKDAMLRGIDDGLLRRLLIVARNPDLGPVRDAIRRTSC